MLVVLPKGEWPEVLDHPRVRGVCLRGCVQTGTRAMFYAKKGAAKTMAHAHITGEYEGWICVRNQIVLRNRLLLLHELAHVITRQIHTTEWAYTLLQIGGTVDEFEVDGQRIRAYTHLL